MDHRGDLAQLVLVLTGVVSAEEKFSAAGEFNSHVGLSAAAIAAVDC